VAIFHHSSPPYLCRRARSAYCCSPMDRPPGWPDGWGWVYPPMRKIMRRI